MNKSAMRDYAPRMRQIEQKANLEKMLMENAKRWRDYKSPRFTDEYLNNLAKNLGFLRSENNARS